MASLFWATNAGALPLRAPALTGDSTTTISYQGRLADSAGNPITSSGVAMQFRLYDVDTGGAPLWEETHAAVPVEDGLFHVLLGSTNPIPVSLLASNSALWLGITVGSDSEMTPREQIASVPYAMVASKLAGEGITTDQIADGAVTSAKLEHAGPHIPITPDENGLVKLAVMRQDDTTDSYKDSQVILTGWGFVRGDGDNLFTSKTVNFGVSFAGKPVVVATIAGFKDNSDPTNIGDVEPGVADPVDYAVIAHRSSATSFKVTAFHASRAQIPSNRRILFSWIA